MPPTNHRRQKKAKSTQLLSEFQQLLAEAPQPQAAEHDVPFEGDLIAWGQHFLPHYFNKPPSKMHIEVAAILDAHSRGQHPTAAP